MGALLLLCRVVFARAWRGVARYAPHRDAGRYARHARARIVVTGASSTRIATPWFTWLKQTLRERHGLRWRYRQPWLLLTGNDKTIARLLPELVEQGHLITDEAVLLWHANDDNGQPNDAWLQQLYRLRRRRPVDGLVLVVNGVEDTLAPTRGTPGIHLARVAQSLHWSAPVYVLDAAQVDEVNDGTTPIAGCEFPQGRVAPSMDTEVRTLRDQLAHLGVHRLGANPRDIYIAKLSERLDGRAAPLSAWMASLVARRLPVRGVFFTPFPAKSVESGAASGTVLPALWSHLGDLTRRDRGRRVGWHPITVWSVIALALVGIGTVGTLVSAFANAHELQRSQAVVRSLDQGDDATRVRALLALQQRIGVYEARVRRRAPGVHGFGLNRNRVTLDTLWMRYADASRALLTIPVQRSLEASLAALGKVRADALQDRDAQQRDYNVLKTYLMLADPAHTDPDFLATQLATVWPVIPRMPPGEWQDTSQRLARFFAQHLHAHPDWRIQPSAPLIATARSTLVNQIGLANADDTVYQSILDGVRGKYADLSLPALLNGTDAQGLFGTSASVPGVYSRAAWDGMIAAAIDQAGERQVESDGVLTDGKTIALPEHDAQRAGDLKQRLTARYFAEYAAAWQRLLNSLHWQPATNLSVAVDQLTRLTDAQTSPLIALMKSVQHQAQAGRPSQALGDTLVRRAQSLVGKEDTPASAVTNPLDQSFGPLLALMGDSGVTTGNGANAANGNAPATLSGVSLQSYITVATTMRLKLQQIGHSPDAQSMARALAQAVFQGKLSDLSQVREQAALTAASLGSAWAGFGDALFLRPLDGAWQTILQPAAASLNELWRASIAAPFNSAFDGRYPFYDTNADASFAELGRYVRPTSGLINRFLTVELAGVLAQQGDMWAPNGLAPQTLAFDPAFLKAIQQMSLLGTRLYPSGDASYRFEIMPQPTPNVTRSELTIDKHAVIYFNQQETWTPIAWPGDGLNGHAALTWQTLDAGVRQVFDATGDWAWLRLLATAEVKPLDSTRYELTWTHPDAESLRYVLRTQVGAGPLDLLALRGFTLPERIFIVGKNGASPVMHPLPPELRSP
ncbi:type VI secretion protein VasK [Dyella sp. M7H15-1]|nr:type VI secretion protein VasK [Dyella sp. M7H15-1]